MIPSVLFSQVGRIKKAKPLAKKDKVRFFSFPANGWLVPTNEILMRPGCVPEKPIHPFPPVRSLTNSSNIIRVHNGHDPLSLIDPFRLSIMVPIAHSIAVRPSPQWLQLHY
jgi:hypothetical protein